MVGLNGLEFAEFGTQDMRLAHDANPNVSEVDGESVRLNEANLLQQSN